MAVHPPQVYGAYEVSLGHIPRRSIPLLPSHRIRQPDPRGRPWYRSLWQAIGCNWKPV